MQKKMQPSSLCTYKRMKEDVQAIYTIRDLRVMSANFSRTSTKIISFVGECNCISSRPES